MFQTRNDLKRRIRDLEEQNSFLLNAQKLAENGGLAKCKSVVCKSCEHAVFINNWCGTPHLIGCDLTVNCKDYNRKEGANR